MRRKCRDAGYGYGYGGEFALCKGTGVSRELSSSEAIQHRRDMAQFDEDLNGDRLKMSR